MLTSCKHTQTEMLVASAYTLFMIIKLVRNLIYLAENSGINRTSVLDIIEAQLNSCRQ